MAKLSATFQTWRIEIADNGSVSVYDRETLCPNSKEALTRIAREAGWAMDPGWTTRQAGRKLVDFLNGGGAAPQPGSTPTDDKPANSGQPDSESSPAEAVTDVDQECASAKIRVYGKAQNRTALGIAHAYMAMHPHATLEDLRKAFPNSLNPDASVKENFIHAEEKGSAFNWNGYFKGEDELLTMGDGCKVAMVSMWTKPSFERLVAHARRYDIAVARFEAADKGGKKGGFRLEYMNGYTPSATRKKTAGWLWIVLGLVVIALILLFVLS